MDSGPVVIDISSEEDDLSSDFPRNASLHQHSGSMEQCGHVKEETCNSGSDDDCVVLDAQTDSPVMIAEEEEGVENETDEILAVGEKGQLACRDYPHPRHHCVIFPFSNTMHEKHCNLCYCYVCDSPAPCLIWEEHCHSTDKEKMWRAERRCFKESRKWHSDTVPPINPPVKQASDSTITNVTPNHYLDSLHKNDKEQRQKPERQCFKESRECHSDIVPPIKPLVEQASDAIPTNSAPNHYPDSLHKDDCLTPPALTTRSSPSQDCPPPVKNITASSSPSQDCTPPMKNITVEIYKLCPFAFSFSRRRPVLKLPEEENFPEEESEELNSESEPFIPGVLVAESQDAGTSTQTMKIPQKLKRLASRSSYPAKKFCDSKELKDKSRLNDSTSEGSSVVTQADSNLTSQDDFPEGLCNDEEQDTTPMTFRKLRSL